MKNEKDTITFKKLEPRLKKRENYEEIKRAYEYAFNEHKGMKRLSGDDFITHPLEVTKILMDLNVDDTTIIASLLHEVINNGNTTFEDLKELFGEEVAMIVNSVSKINKLELPDNNEKSVIYLRKILVGLAEDVRVLYIKLADRLHNMRTNWAINPAKQKEKANETMSVLVPIAHRLGINSIKSELENLSLYYLKPDVYNDILEKLNNTVAELDDYLEEMKESIIELLTDAGITFEIKGRVKSVYSIYNKLNNGKEWNKIYDILALRVFVNTEAECYQVIGLIHSRFRPMPKRFKDYIASPKENMYQSLHTTVFGVEGKVFEIQVRTYEMDEIAEKGVASHWSYKEKGTKKIQNIMEQKLEMFRNVIEASINESDVDFEATVNSNIFSESIYTYTPKGDVIELPVGSTPIDFAYRIHSKVGDTTVGAIVNDQIVPLSYELQNDDVVNIKTNASATPNKDWINIAKTNQAKNKIKAYFSKKDKEEYIAKGKEILEKELRKRRLAFNEVLTTDAINKITKDLKLKDLDDLYLAIGSLRYTAGYIINLSSDDKHNVEDVLLERKREMPKINYKSDILVEGTPNIMVNIAKCCMPVKGDEIIGYITKGQGISVHKRNCPNVPDSKERLIDVAWNIKSTNYYYTNIYVTIKDTKDILAELITEIGKKDSLVRSCKTIEKEDRLIYELNIRIKDKEELEKIENAILKISNVTEVSNSL
ncbi:MAG TPA: bifunctional (p)ppGpp synthetase/guanosine-3',5'-bis(diphosphate) 3'-pyrophosphohydrolase [Candidatus Onthocola stercoravium]|nr:bifunctional (p)ppGpp synthetase/guanosine-3',5'-bis(diphosphate) 3'-pyrophosphohydrolase [Candidatus Onthocola stercoravium]